LKGSIVHISSISAHTGYKGLAMYASTKGALEAFSKNTAREWGERGIRSNCLVAGFMETEMSASLTEDQKYRIYQRTSMKKPTDVDSVAETILFLLSGKASSITGQNIHVDSGTI
jgi:3-oxoacyl-[acyl-carrier protein] reductase